MKNVVYGHRKQLHSSLNWQAQGFGLTGLTICLLSIGLVSLSVRGGVPDDYDPAAVRTGLLNHLRQLQNFRVEFVESRTLTPPTTRPMIGTTQPGSLLHAGSFGKVLYGRFDANCVFAIADSSHCLYQREITPETAQRLLNDKIPSERFKQLIYVGNSATQFSESLDGKLGRYFFENFRRPFDTDLDVDLGLRFIEENQSTGLSTAAVSRSGDNFCLDIPGPGGSTIILVVDPKMGYTVVRYEIKLDDQLLEEDINDQFDEVKPSLFLPRHVVTHSFYDNGKKESQHCEYTVQRYVMGREILHWYQEHSVDPPKYLPAPARKKVPSTIPSILDVGAAEATVPTISVAAAQTRSPAPEVDPPNVAKIGQMRKKGPLLFEEEFDLGEMKSSGEVKHNFVLVNLGSTNLRILKVITSCGCTTASMTVNSIQGDQVLYVPVTVKLINGAKGQFTEQVLLQFEDGQIGNVILELRGTNWSGDDNAAK